MVRGSGSWRGGWCRNARSGGLSGGWGGEWRRVKVGEGGCSAPNLRRRKEGDGCSALGRMRVGEGGCSALGGREPVSSQSAMGWRWLEAGGLLLRRRRWMVVVLGS